MTRLALRLVRVQRTALSTRFAVGCRSWTRPAPEKLSNTGLQDQRESGLGPSTTLGNARARARGSRQEEDMNSGPVQRTNVPVVATYDCGDCGYAHQITGRRDVLPDGMDCRCEDSAVVDLYDTTCRGIMVLRIARILDRDESRMIL